MDVKRIELLIFRLWAGRCNHLAIRPYLTLLWHQLQWEMSESNRLVLIWSQIGYHYLKLPIWYLLGFTGRCFRQDSNLRPSPYQSDAQPLSYWSSSGLGRDRTCDSWIKSPALYHLVTNPWWRVARDSDTITVIGSLLTTIPTRI